MDAIVHIHAMRLNTPWRQEWIRYDLNDICQSKRILKQFFINTDLCTFTSGDSQVRETPKISLTVTRNFFLYVSLLALYLNILD